MRRLLPLGAALAVVVLGCASPADDQPAPHDETVRMLVAPEQVDCVGVAPMRCLQIRYAPDERWQLFYEGITGFTYEPGYAYELTVRVSPVDNPPADHSSRRYDLVSVDSKTLA
ncbi:MULTISPECIES: DUF4377 domain-containing protein [unclassified Nocardia]|uniref:DUF4377 domain-containing protein n=1 Tax=unclassified Nocardia TaxID=2637762 RepID=UPI0033AAE0F5